MSWAFGIPTFDIIRGTAIDYMHCICEGVVDQLLKSWFSVDKKNELYFLGNSSEKIDKDLLSIKPTSEITRIPRSIVDKKDWKGKSDESIALAVRISIDPHVLHFVSSTTYTGTNHSRFHPVDSLLKYRISLTSDDLIFLKVYHAC